MHMGKYVLTLSFLMLGLMLRAENVEARLDSANTAYKNNNFAVAKELYESILAEGYESEIVYYNLGNSYYREGQKGRAILNYERALKLDSDDEDTLHNLKVARRSLLDNLEVLPSFFLSRWWDGMRKAMSAGAWAAVGLLLLWIGIGGIILWIWGTSRARKKLGFVLGIIMLLLSVLPFSLANSRRAYEQHTGYAILMEDEIALRSAPDANSTDILLIHEGLKVAVLDVIGDWYKVKLENGEQGWLPRESVEEI